MAEKKGLIHRFIVGKDRDENYARSTLPSNRWELFWDILKGRFWKIVLLNLMLIVAFVPAIAVLFLSYLTDVSYGAILPFSGTFFVGYPFIPDLHTVMYLEELRLLINCFVLLIPCMIFASLILSGIFYIARNLVWSEGVFIANDFWKGFKQNALHFVFIALILGIIYMFSALNIFIIDRSYIFAEQSFITQPFFNNLFKAIVIIMLVFVSIMALFACTVTVTYKVKFRHLIRNAFYLTLGLLPQNLVIGALCFSPFLIIAIFGFEAFIIGPLAMMIIFFIGFAVVVIGWSIYSHWVFDKFINDRVEGAVKNKGIYPKVGKDGKRVSKKSHFINPKKKKPVKPVTDEEITITELPVHYSRADLERLAKEKEFIKQEGEKWAQEHINDNEYSDDYENEGESENDEIYYEGYEDAMKLEGYEGGDEIAGESAEGSDGESGEDAAEDKKDGGQDDLK